MDTTILLADAANINVNGNLDSLGLGWETTGPSPLPGFVVIVLIKVPMDWPDGQPLDLNLRLVGQDDEVVKQGGMPSTELSFQFRGRVLPASERPANLQGGFAVIAGLPPGLLLDSGIYEWIASIGDEEWRKPFYVRGRADEFQARPRFVDPTTGETQSVQ